MSRELRDYVLCGLFAALAIACAEREPETSADFVPALTLERALAASWDEIDVDVVTGMGPAQKGGTAVVFLHGYGSRGAHLIDLARALADARTRFFLPTAVLPHENGEGRTWWEFIADDWPRPLSDDPEANASFSPSQQLARARAAVEGLLSRIRTEYEPERVILAGHSQGAMLALDVAVAANQPVDSVVAIAGYVMIDSLPAIENFAEMQGDSARPSIFMSHGEQDPIVPFERAERMKRVLDTNGFAVRFHVHTGGHEIDPGAVVEFRELLRP